DRRTERGLACAGHEIRLERLAGRDDLKQRRADGQVDECKRGQRDEIAEQLEPARVAAGCEKRITARKRGERHSGRLERDSPDGSVAKPPHAEGRTTGEKGGRPRS